MTMREKVIKLLWKKGLCKLEYVKALNGITSHNLTREELGVIVDALLTLFLKELPEKDLPEKTEIVNPGTGKYKPKKIIIFNNYARGWNACLAEIRKKWKGEG